MEGLWWEWNYTTSGQIRDCCTPASSPKRNSNQGKYITNDKGKYFNNLITVDLNVQLSIKPSQEIDSTEHPQFDFRLYEFELNVKVDLPGEKKFNK